MLGVKVGVIVTKRKFPIVGVATLPIYSPADWAGVTAARADETAATHGSPPDLARNHHRI